MLRVVDDLERRNRDASIGTEKSRRFASVRLNADVIVDRVTEPLFAPEVTLSRLYAHMHKQELYLL